MKERKKMMIEGLQKYFFAPEHSEREVEQERKEKRES